MLAPNSVYVVFMAGKLNTPDRVHVQRYSRSGIIVTINIYAHKERPNGPLASRLHQHRFAQLHRFPIPDDLLPGSLVLNSFISYLACGRGPAPGFYPQTRPLG